VHLRARALPGRRRDDARSPTSPSSLRPYTHHQAASCVLDGTLLCGAACRCRSDSIAI
jgi:hypothetical protein